MVITWKRAAFAALGVVVAGMIFAWSGIFNVAASSGHWPTTSWFLHWVMRNSVRTYSFAIEPQPIGDPALLYPAAGHFASGCAPCHGAPGEPRSPVVTEMTPPPPRLGPELHTWSDSELFWIVKHGLKYTGMPAWPTRRRDEEVWAMVAFLRTLPEMEAERYRELAFGGAEATPALTDFTETFDAALADCARCHELDGSGRGTLVPIIAGQSEAYLEASLEAYARGERHSGFMQKAAGDADPGLIAELAAHYAEQPRLFSTAAETDPALVERGDTIATEGIPEAGVPACLACHGRDGGNPIFPALGGQHRDYLERQLELFKAGTRGGTRYAHIMQTVAERISEEDIRAVAAYFASRETER